MPNDNLSGPGPLHPLGSNPPVLSTKSGNDPVCNGTGWLWEDTYNQITCWRCAGTGNVPNLVAPKASGTILSVEDGGGVGGESISNEEATNQGRQRDIDYTPNE